MERIKCLLIGMIFLIGGLTLNVYAENLATTSPVGYWKMVDRFSGKPKNIIQIWQANDSSLMGKIIKVFPANEKIQEREPSSSTLGMVILSGLTAHQNQWHDGKIVDPENGKTYDCTLRLAENGKKLTVLGYSGLPFLGRSQTWERVDLLSDS